MTLLQQGLDWINTRRSEGATTIGVSCSPYGKTVHLWTFDRTLTLQCGDKHEAYQIKSVLHNHIGCLKPLVVRHGPSED